MLENNPTENKATGSRLYSWMMGGLQKVNTGYQKVSTSLSSKKEQLAAFARETADNRLKLSNNSTPETESINHGNEVVISSETTSVNTADPAD